MVVVVVVVVVVMIDPSQAALLLCITLGLDTPLREAPRLLLLLEALVTASLMLEVALRAFVQGRGYLKSWWNLLDLAMAVSSGGLFFLAAPRAAAEAQKEDVELSQCGSQSWIALKEL